MNIKDILKTENVGRKFRFIIDGVPSDRIHTIVAEDNCISYNIKGNKLAWIKQILKQNEKYNYQVELL